MNVKQLRDLLAVAPCEDDEPVVFRLDLGMDEDGWTIESVTLNYDSDDGWQVVLHAEAPTLVAPFVDWTHDDLIAAANKAQTNA